MKSKLLIASLLFLGLTGPALATSENLTTEGAYQAQAETCRLGNAPVVGERWNLCEQYIYEFAGTAAVGSADAGIKALVKEIQALLEQIAALAN